MTVQNTHHLPIIFCAADNIEHKKYEDFIALMKAKGYEIKGEDLTDSNLKYISFRPLYSERFIRSSIRTLGVDYTKEWISECIEERASQRTKKRVSFTKKKLTADYSHKSLIDTSQKKFQQTPATEYG